MQQVQMQKTILFILLVVTSINAVLAAPVSYDITINGLVNDLPFNQTKSEVKNCENECKYQPPEFDLPENFTFSDYVISNPSELIESIMFGSTDSETSSLVNDNILIQIKELKEELSIKKLVTRTLNLGQNNLVVEIENTGNKEISEVYVTISGDGVKTLSTTKINLSQGSSDFVTTIVSIENYGAIDIIIKAYTRQTLLGQAIETISVNSPPEEEQTETIYVDEKYAKPIIDETWKRLNEYEKDYFLKISEDFKVPDLSGVIEETKVQIRELQTSYSSLTKEEFNRKKEIIEFNLEDIRAQLELATPQKFSDKLKSNAGVIGTVIGLIVSSLTAWGLVKSHLKVKDQIDKLKKK